MKVSVLILGVVIVCFFGWWVGRDSCLGFVVCCGCVFWDCLVGVFCGWFGCYLVVGGLVFVLLVCWWINYVVRLGSVVYCRMLCCWLLVIFFRYGVVFWYFWWFCFWFWGLVVGCSWFYGLLVVSCSFCWFGVCWFCCCCVGCVCGFRVGWFRDLVWCFVGCGGYSFRFLVVCWYGWWRDCFWECCCLDIGGWFCFVICLGFVRCCVGCFCWGWWIGGFCCWRLGVSWSDGCWKVLVIVGRLCGSFLVVVCLLIIGYVLLLFWCGCFCWFWYRLGRLVGFWWILVIRWCWVVFFGYWWRFWVCFLVVLIIGFWDWWNVSCWVVWWLICFGCLVGRWWFRDRLDC